MTTEKPPIRKLSHICVGSSDIDRTEAFYADLLGARTVHEFRNDQNIRYGIMMAFGQGTFLECFKESGLLTDGTRIRHFCLEVDDLDTQHAIAARLGSPTAIRRGRTDQVLQFMVNDPDGVLIEFHHHDDQSRLKTYTTKLDIPKG